MEFCKHKYRPTETHNLSSIHVCVKHLCYCLMSGFCRDVDKIYSLFRDITHRKVLIPYRPFGTNYRVPIFKGRGILDS